MSSIARTQLVDGWTVGYVEAEEEPRVRDLDLAVRLGYERPRKLRELVRRLIADGKLNNLDVRPVVGRQVIGVAERDVEELWLTQEAAVLVTSQSETDTAWRITREVVRVFLAVQRGALVTAPYAPILIADLQSMIVASVRSAMAEHENSGLIGVARAERHILSELRTIADISAQRRSKAWRAVHRKLQNDLRDLCNIGGARAWRNLPERHLGDIRSQLSVMRDLAEREQREQMALFDEKVRH